MATITSLRRISAKALSEQLLAEKAGDGDPTIAVIDVRDDDYIGGHIRASIHAPYASLEAYLPTLRRRCEDARKVVFHCALSKQRGPSAALRYMRERQIWLGAESLALADSDSDSNAQQDGQGKRPGQEGKKPVRQEVYVLDRGFTGWQEVYGEDERLTEGYRKELWRDGW